MWLTATKIAAAPEQDTARRHASATRLILIQYLRGIAALMIVFFHLFVQLNRFGYDCNPFPLLGAGVDIFFIISGFIMWHTTFGRSPAPREFLRHRVIRIVPLYWIITTIYVIVLLIRPTLFQSDKFALSHIIASYLFIPMPHPVSHAMWPLVVQGWTLNYEMFFYLLFALALLVRERGRAFVVIAMLVCIVGLQVFEPTSDSIIGFYSSSIVLEFALGVALGYFWSLGLWLSRRYAALLMLAGLIGLFIDTEANLPNFSRLLLVGVPACMVVAGAVFYERAGSVAEIAFPALLGDASYSLYLSHGAFLSAFAQLWHEVNGSRVLEPLYLISFSATATILAVAIAVLIYRLIEQPLLRAMSAFIRNGAKSNSNTASRTANQ